MALLSAAAPPLGSSWTRQPLSPAGPSYLRPLLTAGGGRKKRTGAVTGVWETVSVSDGLGVVTLG